MTDRPRLKPVAVRAADGQLVVALRSLKRFYLDDPTGSLGALLRLLAAGRHTTTALVGAMAALGFPVTGRDIADALAALDTAGLLEAADGDDALDADARERHQSNLRFYDLFSTLDRPSASFQAAAMNAHVLLLGAGALGCGVLQSLAGLGVGEITVVDTDPVEIRNLSRQSAYGLDAIGRPKVDAVRSWADGYSTGTRVTPVRRRITDAASVRELGAGADVVVCAIDSPPEVYLTVNEACFALGIPLVVGGFAHSTLFYWSVEPGRTPCWRCLDRHHADEGRALPRHPPLIARSAVNRVTAPLAQMLSGLVAMEAMRYVTRSDPPVAAATYQVIEVADGLAATATPWARHPDCRLCAG